MGGGIKTQSINDWPDRRVDKQQVEIAIQICEHSFMPN